MEVKPGKSRYGMVIDLDRCDGCGACVVACAVENNVPPAKTRATDRTGITWLRVFKVDNGAPFPENHVAFVPMPCQHCDNDTPCVSVCPQNAIEMDQQTRIVTQVPVRCMGCRYCMAACPYHARYFNWWDPKWPEGMEKTLNPDVSPRTRGVVEKCNFCHGRLQAARAKAAAAGEQEIQAVTYVPACVEACPSGAITFGDLADENSEVAKLAHDKNSFRFLTRLKTEPKVYYRSARPFVQRLAESALERMKEEAANE